MPQRKQQAQQRKPPTPAQLAARQRFAEMARGPRQKRTASPSSPPPPSTRQPTAKATGAPSATLTDSYSDSLARELGLTTAPTAPTADASAPAEATDSTMDGGQLSAELEAEIAGESPDSLVAVFNSIAGTEQDPNVAARRAKRAKNVRTSPLRGKSATDTASAAKATTTPSQRKVEREEAEIEVAAAKWYDTGALVFMLVCGWLIGRELRPTEDQAAAITDPLVRILIRHYDPLREASADASDFMESMLALVSYVESIGPVYMEKRRERQFAKQQRQRAGRGRTVYAVPIEQQPAQPAQNTRPAGNSDGPAGHDTGAGGAGNGAHGQVGQDWGANVPGPEELLAEAVAYAG